MQDRVIDGVEEPAGETSSLALRPGLDMEPQRRPAPMAQPRSGAAAIESRVRQTADVDKLMMAFARAQMKFPVVQKNKTASVKSMKGEYTYKYADLADVMEQIGPCLRDEGLAFMTIPTRGVLVGRLIHEPTGQWIEGDLSIVPPDTRGGVQALGSALTYERRYLIASMLNIVLDEDDDGASAQPDSPRRTAPGTLPGELAVFVAQCAADGADTRAELVETMKKNRETPEMQRAALAMFDKLTAPKPEAA